MYHAMDAFKHEGREHQRALRLKGFPTIEQAQAFAQKKATGKPFVVRGTTVVWVG
jgi:hypothetical protein